jgi:hypothetical protein
MQTSSKGLGTGCQSTTTTLSPGYTLERGRGSNSGRIESKEETGTPVSSLRKENPNKEDLRGRERGVAVGSGQGSTKKIDGDIPNPRHGHGHDGGQTDATAGGYRGDRPTEVWQGRGRGRRRLEASRRRTMEIELARGGKATRVEMGRS